MFENLSDRLDSVFKKLKGHGTLNEKNIEDGLKQVRMALLEADVNYRVAKNVISDIKTRALGQEVMDSLTPGQQVIKIVYDEFTRMMGSEHQSLDLGSGSSGASCWWGFRGPVRPPRPENWACYCANRGESRCWCRWMCTGQPPLTS